jgi:hypothetical protein
MLHARTRGKSKQKTALVRSLFPRSTPLLFCFYLCCGLLSLPSSSSPRFSSPHLPPSRAPLLPGTPCEAKVYKRSAALERAKALTLTRPASGTSEFVTRTFPHVKKKKKKTSAHAARPKVARISPIFAAEASQHILAGRRRCQNPHVLSQPAGVACHTQRAPAEMFPLVPYAPRAIVAFYRRVACRGSTSCAKRQTVASLFRQVKTKRSWTQPARSKYQGGANEMSSPEPEIKKKDA